MCGADRRRPAGPGEREVDERDLRFAVAEVVYERRGSASSSARTPGAPRRRRGSTRPGSPRRSPASTTTPGACSATATPRWTPRTDWRRSTC
ncbi:hypothetical protein ACFQRB_20615 [Halobaculum litoreum]|uniref:Uncharacterized protein n=1 Tax=Halobaculum litoreum TaxID=3031998 RepID=A0ABD5XXH6_9EURY